MAILPTLKLNSDHLLVKHFMPHQVNWIEAEDPIHAAHKQVFALAEKSVRIGWTVAEKRFPRSQQDVAADFFALRKSFVGKTWVFTESRNTYNPASHCDIAWAGALASEAHLRRKSRAWALAG